MKKLIILIITLVSLPALGTGCFNNAENKPVDNAFKNLEEAKSYEAKMNMNIEVNKPLELSINKNMNMLYEEINDKVSMFTKVEESLPAGNTMLHMK